MDKVKKRQKSKGRLARYSVRGEEIGSGRLNGLIQIQSAFIASLGYLFLPMDLTVQGLLTVLMHICPCFDKLWQLPRAVKAELFGKNR